MCPHCDGGEADTPDHTVIACPTWNLEREELVMAIGRDLNLEAINRVICESSDN